MRAAIERGIPVICQKPFGVDLKQAETMTAMAEEAGVPLVIHENFRFAPWFREMRRLIDEGFFGRVHGVSFRLRPGDGQGPQAYLDRQPYFQTMPEFLVRETAVHFIDTFRFLMGEVLAITARLRRLNPVILGEDAGILIFEFDDDASGLFDGNLLNEHPAKNLRRTMGEMWLEGERGVMRLDGDARLWWLPHQGVEIEHRYDDGANRGVFGGASTALQAHVLAHLNQGTPLENSARSYLKNLHVQAAIYHSHASGRRVRIPTNPNEGVSHEESLCAHSLGRCRRNCVACGCTNHAEIQPHRPATGRTPGSCAGVRQKGRRVHPGSLQGAGVLLQPVGQRPKEH